MANTEQSFKDKWVKNPTLIFEETLREGSETFNWILQRNGFSGGDDFRSFLISKKRILDAGCGNGRVTALLRKYSTTHTPIVGIDLVAHEVARSNLSEDKAMSFYQKDLLDDLSDLGLFDFIYCQEVLHHTKNPRKAFGNLVSLLETKGEIAIYVYKKKAPVREFVDDYIREKIAGLSYEEAMRQCSEITQFGKALSELKATVTVPKVDLLEIPAGEYSVQRLMYHFFMKCFWNDSMTTDENNVINYDWYHPQDCSRHELGEIVGWYESENLQIVHSYEDFYGITVRGVKSV